MKQQQCWEAITSCVSPWLALILLFLCFCFPLLPAPFSYQEIRGYLGLEGVFKGHLVQSPAMSRDIINLNCSIRAQSNITLNISRDESSIIFLSNLFQSCNTFIVKKFFLIYSLNLFFSSLKPFFSVLSLKGLLKNLPLSKFLGNKVFLGPSLLQAEPQLSLLPFL